MFSNMHFNWDVQLHNSGCVAIDAMSVIGLVHVGPSSLLCFRLCNEQIYVDATLQRKTNEHVSHFMDVGPEAILG